MNAPHPPRARPATYQDVLDAPENRVAQIVRGVLHLHPVWEPRRSRAISGLLFELLPREGGGGSRDWWLLMRVEVHLGGDVLVPDLAGWRRGRLAIVDDPPWIEEAPDWACEVLSPSTCKLDLTEKRDIYAREGVAHLWFVDPTARTLEAFALRDGAWTLLAALKDDDPVAVPPFEAVKWPLAALWPD